MKKKLYTVSIYLLCFGLGLATMSFAQKQKASVVVKGFPTLEYGSFKIGYDSRSKIPLWTYEFVSQESLKRNASRSKLRFRSDPNVYSYHRSYPSDYTHQNYDKGHMVAAGNHQHLEENLKETFYLSNAAPQHPNLNRGFWAKLESHVRKKAQKQPLEVITGPLFLPTVEGNQKKVSYEVIGERNVAVPTHFFKVIVQGGKSSAYIVPNQAVDVNSSFDNFKVSITELEKASGLHFDFKTSA